MRPPPDCSSAAAVLARCRALVFDLDGTLIDTLGDLTASLNVALSELSLPAVDASVVRSSLHGGLEATVEAALETVQVSGSARSALLARYAQLVNDLPASLSRPYPGVGEFLSHWVADRTLAVCTNKSQAAAESLLQQLGLAGHFVCVVGADTCERRKPHPAPLLHALQRLGVPRGQAAMIGDSRVDYACAQAAGVACLLHSGGYDNQVATHCPEAIQFEGYGSLLRAALQDDVPRQDGLKAGHRDP